ncbi:MAG: AraC family transcriptional regulator [Planctomycetota bacterium]|jgi:AraC-like DNA-binding protein|nr:AraC family transcriptional regulator [Planctomycetota bacterium]
MAGKSAAALPAGRHAGRGQAFLGGFITLEQFNRLQAGYGHKHGVSLAILDPGGILVAGRLAKPLDSRVCRRVFPRLQREAMRWGEPAFDILPNGRLAWVAPLMLNLRLMGGLAAQPPDPETSPGSGVSPALRDSAAELLRLLEEENLTNAPFLESRRSQTMSERLYAEAIHAFKAYSPDFRTIYIREEPALMAAIRRGALADARGILNNILVVLHQKAGLDLSLSKSFFLEIITMMSRTAVEIGCDAEGILGKNYDSFLTLAGIKSYHEIAPWLHGMLERLMAAIHRQRVNSPAAFMQLAVSFMQENLHRRITRDQVAGVVHLSPVHFSRLFKKELRESFTDALNRMRVDLASELLLRRRSRLCDIALDCGFSEQSYFTKVFRKYTGKTPREYRRSLAPARPEA